jgi:hypothetical protein
MATAKKSEHYVHCNDVTSLKVLSGQQSLYTVERKKKPKYYVSESIKQICESLNSKRFWWWHITDYVLFWKEHSGSKRNSYC